MRFGIFAFVELGLALATALLGYLAGFEDPPGSGEAAEAYALSQPILVGGFWLCAAVLVLWSALWAKDRIQQKDWRHTADAPT